jgi:CHAT domain-containing protein
MNKLLIYLFLFFSNWMLSQIDSVSYYLNKKEYEKGLKYCNELKNEFTNFEVENNKIEYSKLLFWIGFFNEELKNYDFAIENYNNAATIVKDFQERKLFCDRINYRIINIFLLDNNYKKVIEEYEKGKKEDLISIIKEDNLDEIVFFMNIADSYFNLEEYNKAESIYKDIIIPKTINNREINLQLSVRLLDIARYKINQNEWKETEDLFVLITDLIKKNNLEKEKINYYLMIDKSTLLKKQNKLELAEKFIKTKILNDEFLKQNIDIYLHGKANIAEIYLLQNEYSKAEKEYLEIIKHYRENESSILNPNYPTILSALANIYIILGNYDTAERLLVEALDIEKKMNITERNNHLALSLASLGNIFLKKRMFPEALLKYEEAILHCDKNSYLYASLAYSIALVHLNYFDFEKSWEYLIQAEIIQKKTLPNNHPEYLKTLSLFGTISSLLNKYDEAEAFYKKSYENGNFNSNYNLATFYFKRKKNDEVSFYLENAVSLWNKGIIDATNHLSEYEVRTLLTLRNEKIFMPLSFISINSEKYSSLYQILYDNQLLRKNLSLRNQQRIKTTIEKNGDATVKQKYQQFIDNKQYITKIEELTVAQRPTTYNQLKAETESLEKELTRLSSTFAEAKKTLLVSWKQIQEKLKPNEVVIDLVSFNYYNTKWTDSIMYGAFVIKKDSKFPKFINLFEENQLSVLLERKNKAHDSIQSKIINKQYSDTAISDLFYKPLEAELKNSNTIYLAPSGLAHQINFKALPINTNETLGEKYKLILLGATTTLIDYKPLTINKKNNFELVLYGGIDYNKKQVEVYKEAYPNELNDLATRSGILEFNYLPGTNDEVNKINKEAITYNFKTTIKTESAATEESVKQLSGKANPFILHLATHGFFFENTKQELSDLDKNIPVEAKKRIYLASEDPMMRSGLLLAGANNSWRKTNNETNADDGILTAKEIANLDLSNCKLVVLSACETGLGQINGSEGVFGLQRAFKMAGVQNIIMSLWKVPDVQTAELFENFYAACFSGKSIQEAFNEAQNKMKEKYTPYYWAGFVLLE